MEPQTLQPYDITSPPEATYPLIYIAGWCLIFVIAIGLISFLKSAHNKKNAPRKQLNSILELLKDSSNLNDIKIRPALAVLTKAARRYECDEQLIKKTEEILFMDHRTHITEDLKKITRQLAEQIDIKLKEQKFK